MMRKVKQEEFLALAQGWLSIWREIGEPQFSNDYIFSPMQTDNQLSFWIGESGYRVIYEVFEDNSVRTYITVLGAEVLPFVMALLQRRFPTRPLGMLEMEDIHSAEEFLQALFAKLEETHIVAALACDDADALMGFSSSSARAALASIQARCIRNQMSPGSAQSTLPQRRL